IVFESGENVGHNILKWQHVQLFSPWQYDIDKAARQLLEETDWESPQDNILPTGKELVDQYLVPLRTLPVLIEAILYKVKVIYIKKHYISKKKPFDTTQKLFQFHINKTIK